MKKYMIYSFGTLWTLVLIVALVAAVIHQTQYQGSPSEVKLKSHVYILERQNQLLSDSLDQQATEHAAYRRWVRSWHKAW
jgi:hypothetical protein